MSEFIITGTFIHCLEPFQLEIIENGYILIRGSKIISMGIQPPIEVKNCQQIQLSKTQFLMPGLVDTHIHAPQYPNIGLGYDKQLLDWLETYTFKLELKYSDTDFAKKVYSKVVRKTLDYGTTTASYFSTIHLESSIILADEIIKHGQRARVGLVNMIKNAPDNLLQDRDQSVEDTEKFIQTILDKDNQLVSPVVTPRFALSCDEQLLSKLGALAKKYDVHIQSHISENKSEIEATLQAYPNAKTYAEVYDQGNLLTDKTIMAHGVYLLNEENQMLVKRGTSVSHCPNSNTCLQSGLADVRELLNAGVTVGLGTDVAGGCNASIIDAMRSALDTSIHLSFNKPDYKPLNYIDVFYLATLGGAEALSMEDKIGNFVEGKDFDALIIDVGVSSGPTDCLSDCSPQELLQKFIYTGDDRNVQRVFVAGHTVKNI